MESQEASSPIFTDPHEGDDVEGQGGARNLSPLIFAIASVGFLAFLAIGSVEARIWRFGRLYFEDRTVREVWAYLGNHLPDMPGQPVITALFWISVTVMVLGTVLGVWLILGTADEDGTSGGHLNPSAPNNSTHA